MKTLINYSASTSMPLPHFHCSNESLTFVYQINKSKEEKAAYHFEFDLNNSSKMQEEVEKIEQNDLLEQAALLIKKHLHDSAFGKKQLSQAIGLSPSQLYRQLKTQTGCTPVSFIRKIRLRKALEMLEVTGLNISEIAYEVGFNDPNYFSRIFQKEYGASPKLFREQNGMVE